MAVTNEVSAAADAAARRIEEASLRAWPALTDTDFDGWRLRFSRGYTRRANSITPLGASMLSLDDKLATCERLYAERDLPPIFRLTPFAPPELDDVLARRGYRLGDRVEVRALDLAAYAPPAPMSSLQFDPYSFSRFIQSRYARRSSVMNFMRE